MRRVQQGSLEHPVGTASGSAHLRLRSLPQMSDRSLSRDCKRTPGDRDSSSIQDIRATCP
jgi:hypothetical protein